MGNSIVKWKPYRQVTERFTENYVLFHSKEARQEGTFLHNLPHLE
jgi:hypothetical protein